MGGSNFHCFLPTTILKNLSKVSNETNPMWYNFFFLSADDEGDPIVVSGKDFTAPLFHQDFPFDSRSKFLPHVLSTATQHRRHRVDDRENGGRM